MGTYRFRQDLLSILMVHQKFFGKQMVRAHNESFRVLCCMLIDHRGPCRKCQQYLF